MVQRLMNRAPRSKAGNHAPLNATARLFTHVRNLVDSVRRGVVDSK
jgi:hypothetical protein